MDGIISIFRDNEIQELSNWPRDTDEPSMLPHHLCNDTGHFPVQKAGVLYCGDLCSEYNTTTSQHDFLTSILERGFITKENEVVGKKRLGLQTHTHTLTPHNHHKYQVPSLNTPDSGGEGPL